MTALSPTQSTYPRLSISSRAMDLVPLTHANLCAEMERLQREISAEVRLVIMESQDMHIAAMQEALRKEILENATKGRGVAPQLARILTLPVGRRSK